MKRLALGPFFATALTATAQAETINVAVAANFTAVAEKLAALFAEQTEHELVLSFGSTGQLYTQITQAAPFQVFLSADAVRPQQAIDEGFAVEDTAFVYAVGELVLYSPSIDVSGGEAALTGDYENLSIADPVAAPYGAAAVETLESLGLYDDVEGKLVTGENITQALQFVESGSAELGFVAASQVIGKSFVWAVPADLYAPIEQGAVLLEPGRESEAAIAFIDFLKSDDAVAIIEASGYSVP